MEFTFTAETAATILKFASPLIVLVLGYVFTSTEWDKRVKIGLIFAMSAVLGALTSYAEGKVELTGNFWDNFAAVFTSSQMAYWGLMKVLKLELRFAPVEAAASQAADQARSQIADLPIQTVKDAINPETEIKLETTVQVTDS